MKALCSALLIFGFTQLAQAREPKATLFGDLAQQTVVTMYGRSGDVVKMELTQMNHGEPLTETWNVSLTNGAETGSANYEVEITAAQDGAEEGKEVGTVKVRYLGGT